MTSEYDNEEDNVENIDVVVSNDVPESHNPSDIDETELLSQDDDGDFDDDEVLDDDIDEEDSDESSDEESEDDSDGEFDDEDDEAFEDADDDAQFTDDVVDSDTATTLSEPAKQTVVIETLPITGEPRVDDALSRLSDLEGLPVHEHGDVFEDVRRRLHGTLSDLSGQ